MAVRFIAVIVPSLLLLTACSGEKALPTPSATPTADSQVSVEVAPDPTELAPLRGTTVPAGSLAHPSLAAKIDNHKAARPQIALERADIVFEELVEGGITRYVALWQSDIPELLGPVRSIRPMDPDIITPFGGIVAYSGGQERFVEMMMATPVVNSVFDYDDTGLFYRIDGKDSPHDVVVKAAELVGQHAELPQPQPQFAYAAIMATSSAVLKGTPINTINTRFSNTSGPGWAWDAARQTYLRTQEGEPDLDSDGAQLQASNVVIMRVAIDWTYGVVPKTTMIGSGEAWVSAGGKTVHATWAKDSQAAPIQLVDDYGVTIRLTAGNTWIELVPTDRGSVELLP